MMTFDEFEFEQCYANRDDGSRCVNLTKNVKVLHCEEHLGRALILYHNCKKQGQKMKEMKLKLQKIKHLSIRNQIGAYQKFYIICKKAYNARLEHRNYAISKECYDQGHNFQFIDIAQMIFDCEEKLEELYTILIESNSQNQDISNIVTKDNNNEEKNDFIVVKADILEFQTKRKEDERLTNIEIEKCIQKNKKLDKWKKNLYNGLCIVIQSMLKYDPKYEKHFECEMFMLLNAVSSLQQVGYFSDNFNPLKLHDGEYLQLIIKFPKKHIYENFYTFSSAKKLAGLCMFFRHFYQDIKNIFYEESSFWNQDNIPYTTHQYFIRVCSNGKAQMWIRSPSDSQTTQFRSLLEHKRQQNNKNKKEKKKC